METIFDPPDVEMPPPIDPVVETQEFAYELGLAAARATLPVQIHAAMTAVQPLRTRIHALIAEGVMSRRTQLAGHTPSRPLFEALMADASAVVVARVFTRRLVPPWDIPRHLPLLQAGRSAWHQAVGELWHRERLAHVAGRPEPGIPSRGVLSAELMAVGIPATEALDVVDLAQEHVPALCWGFLTRYVDQLRPRPRGDIRRRLLQLADEQLCAPTDGSDHPPHDP
jgi:hypothetical protein